MKAGPKNVRVRLVAIPEVMASTLMGLYDVLNSLALLSTYSEGLAGRARFDAEIVATTAGRLASASGVPIEARRSIEQIDSADVIIIPSILVDRGEWQQGRYPAIVKWLTDMHAAGAQLCSACSGVLLLAETGLLDGKDATVHWMYAATFRRNFPNVRLRLDRALVAAENIRSFSCPAPPPRGTIWFCISLRSMRDRRRLKPWRSSSRFNGMPINSCPRRIRAGDRSWRATSPRIHRRASARPFAGDEKDSHWR